MATFKVELKPEPNADRTHTLRLRVTAHRQHAYFTLRRIAKAEYNPKAKPHLKNWLQKHPYADAWNQDIKQVIDRFDDLSVKHPALTAKELKALYVKTYVTPEPEPLPEHNQKYIVYFKAWIARKRGINKHATAEAYQGSLNRLLAFAGADLSDSRILSTAFASALHSFMVKKEHKPNTIATMFSNLNTVYGKGVKEGLVPAAGAPFEIQVNRMAAKKERPEVDAVFKLADMTFTKRGQTNARNALLLQFCMHGARISEALTLKWENVHADHVEYLPGKNAKKVKQAARTEMMNRILEYYPKKSPYVLPYIKPIFETKDEEHKNQYLKSIVSAINRNLKNVAKLAGINVKLSTHMARHAFADAVLETENDMRVVQELIGHSALATTENYVSDLKRNKVSAAAARVFDRSPDRQTIGEQLEENNRKEYPALEPENNEKPLKQNTN